MDLRQLEYFVAVAEELSFTRAAARCRVAQSALSHQVARLERRQGVVLFERTSRAVRLAPAGELLLPPGTSDPRGGRRDDLRAGRVRRGPHRAAAVGGRRQHGKGRTGRRAGPCRLPPAAPGRADRRRGHREPAHGGAGSRRGAGPGVRRVVRRPGTGRPRASRPGGRAAGRRPAAGSPACRPLPDRPGRVGRRGRLRRDAGRHRACAPRSTRRSPGPVCSAVSRSPSTPRTRWRATSDWASAWPSYRRRPPRDTRAGTETDTGTSRPCRSTTPRPATR